MSLMESMENKVESKVADKGFENANSWEEQEEMLDAREFILGSKKEKLRLRGGPVIAQKRYSIDEIKDRISKTREGHTFFNAIPSSEGLRDKVIELKVKDVTSWKELKETLTQMHGMKFGGSEKKSHGYWYERVEDIEKHDLDPIHMTSKYGLRSKVIELRGK